MHQLKIKSSCYSISFVKILKNTCKTFDMKWDKERLVWFVGFYGISTFVGYSMPNPFLCK